MLEIRPMVSIEGVTRLAGPSCETRPRHPANYFQFKYFHTSGEIAGGLDGDVDRGRTWSAHRGRPIRRVATNS
jgi:hypothetical protein